ncbi:hypothetical protein HQ585_15050 [candidate division KSB1 bacterium]|nr:hypothetical protein [candidate division KSB1 bacterium]
MNTHGNSFYAFRWIIMLCLFLGIWTFACDRNSSPSQPESQPQKPDPPQATPLDTPSGNLIHASGCKETTGVASKVDVPRNMDCMQWSYDSAGILYMTHVNTGFNCCPDSVFAQITISDTSIWIQEGERDGLCDCLCLFDLEYLFEDISPSEYTIRIEGLYRMDEDSPLEHTINLADSTEGQFCVQRDYYPWSVY